MAAKVHPSHTNDDSAPNEESVSATCSDAQDDVSGEDDDLPMLFRPSVGGKTFKPTAVWKHAFCNCCRRRRNPSRNPTGSRLSVHSHDCRYPMYVISVQDLMPLEALVPHQQLLREGKVKKFARCMRGRVIFISHEWLAWDHADPCGEQFATLKRALSRLMRGDIAKVESYWVEQLTNKDKSRVLAEEWRTALPHMYVWMDFISIPQDVAYMTLEDEVGIQTKAKAIESIPAYIERTTLIVVLAPVCAHQNRNTACCLATWRRRGWCRTELQAASLKCGPIKMVVFTGPEARPYLKSPANLNSLVPGT